MTKSRSTVSRRPTALTRGRLAESLSDARHFWEPGRLAFNGVLVLVAFGWLIFTWPHFARAFSLPALGALSVLVLLANLCYSVAYLADIPLQYSHAQSAWRFWRWGVWLLGTLLAVVLEMYWIADEIYPSVS